ncbi:hypothetical protein QYM36_008156 [Artemia franciscana]|uniref:Guanine nucleotide-binding protein-like 1 n=1 Tax=Artemia franciscana TaxID=6661 RepID=A0AA88IPC4_ARTSF|nr:hypothetical protein QYM36_008156 [Artemia franciscana]
MQQLKSDFVEELESIVSLEPESPQTQRKELYSDRILTIGAIGHPNVGKSSVLNALTGRKVVSVSKTPGHTKHFQTVNLTNTVKLLDCPGLVFPSKAPKNLQVLAGCYPISQLREPYSAIRFMAEHINIPSRLHLIHQSNEIEWSPYDICDAWAVKVIILPHQTLIIPLISNPELTFLAVFHLLKLYLFVTWLCL